MTRMSGVAAVFMILSCGFCYAVQVFVKGAHGMVSWKDTPTWRDRSAVPTPPPEDVAAYKKREEIPYPYQRVHVVRHVYVGPRTSTSQRRKTNKKKNLIQKMFFSLPVGAELPIYYTHKQVPVSHKKSSVADSEVADNEGSRYFSEETIGPFRSNTWGLEQPLVPASHKKITVSDSEVADNEGGRYFSEESIGPFRSNTWGLEQPLAENEELSPDLETRTIAKQNLLPSSEGDLMYHGIGGQYLRPRTLDRYRLFKNRGLFFRRPFRTQRILNVYRRSKTPGLRMTTRDVSKTKKLFNEFSKLENVGYVTKDKNIKKSGLPKGIR